MAASNGNGRANRTDRTGDRTLSRYDVLLLVIPVTFVLALAASQVSPFGLSTLMAAASVVGGLAVADGLFVNPPHNGGQ